MASHFLSPSRDLPRPSSRLRHLASLMLVAALATSTFGPTRIPNTVGESRRVSRVVEARDPQVTPHPRFSQDPTTINGRDRRKHHGALHGPLAEFVACSVYPIALSSNSLAHVAAGEVIADIYNGAQPGNFGWLSWTGNASEPTLVASLTPPGDSSSYVNPNNPSDHEVSVGDWMRGMPGVSNSQSARDALDHLKTQDIVVPVWNEASGQGSNALYRLAAFAKVRLLSYELPGQSRISARFLGYTECPIPVNEAPQVEAGPDQTITLPAAVELKGVVTDDGLPQGSTLSVLWTKVSGPGSVTFANSQTAITSATFSEAGSYVLRLTANDSQLSSSDELTVTFNAGNQPPVVNAGSDQSISLQDDEPNFTLRKISTGFNSPIGIDYHQPSNKLVMSVNYDTGGQPSNFELVGADGGRTPFSNIHGLTDEIKIATARDEGNGMSRGGFRAGELFVGTGRPGVIARVSPDGSVIENPWIYLPEETGLFRGSLYVDRTGVFGGDLIAVTTTGGVWRISSTARVTLLTRIGSAHLEGLATIPNDQRKYGPWAGKILIGAEDEGLFWTVDTAGNSASYSLGISPEDIDIIPEHENFFGIDYSGSTLWGAPAAAFANMTDDILVAQETAGLLWRVHWNGTTFEKTQLAQVSQWEHVTFAPVGVLEIPPVGTTVTLNGTASDDGSPPGSTLTYRWTKVSGPGSVTFSNPNQATTTASSTEPGTYILRLSVSDSELTKSDEVTINVNPGNHSPSVDAGPDQTITLPAAADLSGAVSDDGLPRGSTLTVLWTKVSGPGDVTFANPTSSATTARFSAPGTYVLRLTANDSQFSRSDDVIISVNRIISPLEGATLLLEPALAGPNVIGATQSLKATLKDRNNIPVSGATIQFVVSGVNPMSSNSTTGDDGVAFFTYTGALSGSDAVRASTTSGSVTIQSNFASVSWAIPAQPISTTTVFGRFFTSNGSGFFSALPTQQPVFSQYFPGINFNPPENTVPGNTSGVGEFTRPFTNVTTDLSGNFTGTIVAQGNGFQAGQGALDNFNAVFTGSFTVSSAGDITFNFFSDDGFIFGVGNGAKRVSGSYLNVPPSGLTPFESLVVVGAYNAPTSPIANSVTVHFPAPGIYSYEVDYSECCSGQLSLTMTTAASGNHGVPPTGSLTLSPNIVPPLPVGQQRTFTVLAVDLSGAALVGVPLRLIIKGANAQQLNSVTDGSGHTSFSYTGINSGVDTLQVTAPTGSTTAYSNVVTVEWQGVANNQAPTVNAGPDQTVAFGNTATLSGAATDDGQPAGATLTVSWTKVSGPGNVIFSNLNQLISSATFSAAGTYALRLTASDSQLASSADLIITVLPQNQPPHVDAGLRQTIKLPDTVNLDGTVSDDGIPTGGVLTVTWSKVSGPGSVTFGNANAMDTNAAFSSIGYYVLRLTASDSLLGSHSDVTIKVLSADATIPGGVFVTGHDSDFHAAYMGPSTFENPTGAKHIIQRAVAYVTFSKPNPRMLLVTDVRNPGSSAFGDSRLGVQAAGFAFDVADYGSGQQGALDLHTVNFSNYDVILVASDYGGWLRQDELDILNARRSEIISYINNGGGLVALAESGSQGLLTSHDRFGFLPSLLSQVSLDHDEIGITLTAAGLALGLTTDDVNGNASHNGFASTGGMDIIDLDPGNRIISLALRGKHVTTSGYANDAPVVSAGPDQSANLPNAAVTLNGVASDDGQPPGSTLAVQWSKVSGPGSVTFSSPNQAVSNATFSTAGTYVLRLTASDSQLTISDDVSITVNQTNQPPVVNAGSDQIIAFGNAVNLNGSVADDGIPAGATLAASWTKVSGPGTVIFGNANQLATTATFSLGGRYVLRISVSDSQLTGNDELTVTVNQAPVTNAGPDQAITLPSEAALNYTVSDDGLPAGNTTVTWSKVSGPGSVNFENAGNSTVTATFSEAGVYVLRLSADDSHLTATDEVTVTVNSAAPAPVVSIISPVDEIEITTQANVVGSVSDGDWKLEHSLFADEGAATQWTTFATGVGTVSNARLGVFDPTMLLNGRYLIRLSATRRGLTASTVVGVVVSEEQKVGNFTVSFTDLSVPVAGLPIEVTRTYDSRDKRQGDFGIGWTLGVRNVRLQESRAAGAQWQGDVFGGQFPNYCINPSKLHVVTVTLANGRVYKFEAVLSPGNGCQAFAPLQEVTLGFRALPGTNATLIPLGENPLLVHGPFPGAIQLLDSNTVAPVDYDLYQLILEDGTSLFINQHTGLTQMIDTNGNSLTVNNAGIIHSNGKSITFTRDNQGRITQITDPAGNSMTYNYDASGDLINFTDREGQVTTFGYNSTHGLLTIKDPRGIQPLRNEYDPEGRLIRQFDALGKEIKFVHDLNAQEETMFDRLGHVTVYDYDARGNVLRVQDAEGNVTTRTYDGHDNLLSETNALGKTVSYTYDDQDNRLTETDALGNTTVYTYNSRKQVLTATDPDNGLTTYTYDANGNQTAVKDALGHTTTATFSPNGLQLTNRDALNNVTTFEYDASGNLIKQTDPVGNVTTYTYDANGNRLSESQTRIINSATQTLLTTFEYDKLGRQTKVTYPDGSKTETIYNSIGRQSVTIDQLGRRTSYDYDDMGQLIRTTYPDGTREQTDYDFEGRRVKSIDRANRATSYAYDSLGRLEKVTYADAASIMTTYDSVGQVIETKDALNNTTRYEYDAAGRRTKLIDALNHETIFAYDTRGNQISMKDALGETTSYIYDANNRRTEVVFPDNTRQKTEYDRLGQVISKTDQASVVTRFEYDARGKLIKVTDALGGITRYAYDEQGSQLSQTDANNRTTTYAYDQMGRRIRRTLPLGMSETYAFDLAGNLTSRTDFRGKTTTIAYDVMNRMLGKTPDASLAEPAVTFAYTPTGRRLTMNDASGTTSYSYDTRDRLIGKVTNAGTLSYSYDLAGNLKSMRSLNPNGVTVDYDYDTLNRMSNVRDNRLAGATTSYTYDANGNLETATYPNAVRTTYSYDNLNRLKNVNSAKGATLANYAYTLGEAGNRLSVLEAGGRKVEYDYDALYRLKGEKISNDLVAANNGSINYTYDAVGNRLNRTSTVGAVPTRNSAYDENDRLTNDAYDLNGNTTASEGNLYQYDFENRLISLNGGAVRFVYDGDGNRVAKILTVTSKRYPYGKGKPVAMPINGVVTINYLVDTNNPTGRAQVVEELVESSVQRTYTYGHDLISQNQLIGGVWTPSFYGYDGHGSVRYLTNAAGAITDTYTYDAFGNLIAQTGTTPNDYLYAGEQLDANLGFYYLRARWMNASDGRFQTMDKFEGRSRNPISLHKYLYASVNPANEIDPSGREGFTLPEQWEAVGVATSLAALGTFSSYLILLQLQQSLPLSVVETLPRKPLDYILIFYRGVSGYEAEFSVRAHSIDVEALLEAQGEGHHLDFGPGYYMTKSSRTANYFASDYADGRGGGPAVLRIEILNSLWNKEFRRRPSVREDATISDAPGHFQTFVPPSMVRLFGFLARFSEMEYLPNNR